MKEFSLQQKDLNLNFGDSFISQSEQLLIEIPIQFLKQFDSSIPKIFLRTRNINSSVRFQNAPIQELRVIVKELLDHGFIILNSGVPAASLNIKSQNYFEFSHNLPISLEIYLSKYFDFVMQTAWAGLFTAFSSIKKPLITFDQEWSLSNIPNPISLLKARKIIGIKDIELGAGFAADKHSISSSVRKILSYN